MCGFFINFYFLLTCPLKIFSFPGKRMCPGDELFRMMSCGLITRLFRHTRIELAQDPPTDKEMQGIVGVTLTPPKTLFTCVPI